MSLPLSRFSSRRTNFLSGEENRRGHDHQSEICLPKESTGRVNLMKNSRSSDDQRRDPRGRSGEKKRRRKSGGGGKKRGEKQRVELMTAFYIPFVVYIPPPSFCANPSASIPPKAQRIGRQRDLSRITLKQCKQPGCR